MSLESIKKSPKYIKALDNKEQEFINSLSYQEKKEFLSLPNEERENIRDSMGQGLIDSLSDNFLIRATIYVGLVKEMKLSDLISSEYRAVDAVFQKIIDILISQNEEYEILQPDIEDINEIYDNFSNELLEDYCFSFADAYTPGGESFNVLINEMGASLSDVDNLKKETRIQITTGLELLYSYDLIQKDKYQNYIDEVLTLCNF